jgi:hypothetical protein
LLIVLLVCLLVGCAEGGDEQAAAPAPAPARGTGARPYGNVARKEPRKQAHRNILDAQQTAATGSVCSCMRVCVCVCVCVFVCLCLGVLLF